MTTTLADNHQINVRVSGMDCAGCAKTVETALNKLPQVETAKVSAAREMAQIVLKDNNSELAQIEKTIKMLGFGAETLVPAVEKEAKLAPVSMSIQGMDCGGCAKTVEKALNGLPGLSDVKVSVGREQATFLHDPSLTPAADIQEIVKKLGFTAGTVATSASQATDGTRSSCCSTQQNGQVRCHSDVNDVTVREVKPSKAVSRWQNPKTIHAFQSAAVIGLAYIAMMVNETVGYYAFMAATIFALYPVAKRAFMAARFGAFFTIHMLMTLAAAGALIIGEQEEAAIVILLFMVGEMLEGVAADRARAGIKALGKLLPQTARVEQDKTEIEVPINQLRVGQTVVVRSGDRLPADGVILEGM